MSDTSSQLDVISQLLQLEKNFRKAQSIEELAYVLVNDSRYVFDYRQAVLWRMDNHEVFTVSGIAVVDHNAPFIVWLKNICQQLSLTFAETRCEITKNDVKHEDAQEWSQWFPPYVQWLPLSSSQTGLLLAKNTPWTEGELYLLDHLAETFNHAWRALDPRPAFWHRGWLNKKKFFLVLLLFFSALLLPVKQTVLAPASVIAAHPTIIRAAIDGVVERFYIQPNEMVEEGQALIDLDDNTIRNKLLITRKKLAVAEAEYRKTAQQAMFDQKSKSQLTILKARIEQHQAEVKSMEDWLSRISIISPHKGLAFFSDVNDWIGRPVKLGERLLMLAEPDDVELEIQLPIADAINLQKGAKVLLFLNIAPVNPVEAEVYYAAYQAQLSTDNLLTYRLKAHFKNSEKLPRIGLKGTAKVYGEQVPLVYYLLRRPLAVLRQWLGL